VGKVLKASLDITNEGPNILMLDAYVIQQIPPFREHFVAAKYITNKMFSIRKMCRQVPLKIVLDLEGFAALLAGHHMMTPSMLSQL
jgi:hypothetical protein